MESLLMQLAMAALSQFGGGLGDGMPMAAQPPMRPRVDQTSTMQAISLAATTCLLRNGQLSREQAMTMLDQQGRSKGWRSGWGASIPTHVVDHTIGSAGGCRSLLTRIRHGQNGMNHVAGVNPGSRSEQEGFGLYPYR